MTNPTTTIALQLAPALPGYYHPCHSPPRTNATTRKHHDGDGDDHFGDHVQPHDHYTNHHNHYTNQPNDH